MSDISTLQHLDEILLFLIKDKKSFYNYTQHYTEAEKELATQRCYELGFKATFSDINDTTEVTLVRRPTKLTLDLKLSNRSLASFDNFAAKTSSLPMAKYTEMKTAKHNNINIPIIKLNAGVCPPKISTDALHFETYSTYPYRKTILDVVRNNNVTIVVGKSGCGKTTQIPQYLLAELEEKPVNIVCIEPNHISTVVAAKSVAKQRGEEVGSVIGYYLQMESLLSPQTCLTYATSDVFIQTLITDASFLEQINYLIIDEIHLRSRYIDFILVCIREYMSLHDNLKLILLSATPHVDIYMRYFECDSLVDIPSRTYPVEEFFVEDVIEVTEYISEEMHKRMAVYDDLILECMDFGKSAKFAELHDLVLRGDVDVNYYERKEGYTVLMAAAAHGIDELVEECIHLGANIHAKCKSGENAHTFASRYCKYRAAGIIESAVLEKDNPDTYPHYKIMASIYKQTTSDNVIDFKLIVEIIEHIQLHSWDNMAILIFLPTYDYIIDCYNFIAEYPICMELKLMTLHAEMHLQGDHELFQPSEERKVILATDVAQSSFQIKDVGYVIDSGRLKPSTSSMPSIVFKWISQLSAVQRKSRAAFQSGGKCYRLYSKQTYDMFNFDNTAELLDAPLQDMCLRAKLIIPHLSITHFFNKAVEPPSTADVKRAIKDLNNLGLLDAKENLTILGLQTVQIFVEPQIAKLIFYGLFLKCLDPVLSIASVLVYKDPFAKSNDPTTSAIVQTMINELSQASYSDHLAMLFAYQTWQKMRSNAQLDESDKNWLNEGVMEDIIVVRANLLTQLRATHFVLVGCRDNLPQLNKYSKSSAMVKAALAASLYPNVAIAKNELYLTRNELVAVDPPSCLIGSKIAETPLAYIYQEYYCSADLPKIKYVTAVSPITIALFCGPRAEYDTSKNLMRLDKKITIKTHHNSIWKFRYHLHKFFSKYLSNPQMKCNSFEDDLHEVLYDVLNREDDACNLAQPQGVGRKPVFVHLKSAEYEPRRKTDRYISDLNNVKGPNKFNKNFDIEAFVNDCKHLNLSSEEPKLTNLPNSWANEVEEADGQGCSSTENYNLLPPDQVNDTLQNKGSNELAAITSGYFQSLESEEAWGVSVPEIARSEIQAFDFQHWTIPKARFFIIRPLEMKSIHISKTQRVWKFTAQTEKKIFSAFMKGVRVFLFYAIRGTLSFQGIAELKGTRAEFGHLSVPIHWIGTHHVNFIDIPDFTCLVHPVIEDGNEVPYHLGVTIFNMMIQLPVQRQGVLGRRQGR